LATAGFAPGAAEAELDELGAAADELVDELDLVPHAAITTAPSSDAATSDHLLHVRI
jgi:hypothetical protein